MACPICHKRIWFWQKTLTAGVSSTALEVYNGHAKCVRKERKRTGKQNTTESFIDRMMGDE